MSSRHSVLITGASTGLALSTPIGSQQSFALTRAVDATVRQAGESAISNTRVGVALAPEFWADRPRRVGLSRITAKRSWELETSAGNDRHPIMQAVAGRNRLLHTA